MVLNENDLELPNMLIIAFFKKETLHMGLGQGWGKRGRWGGLGQEEEEEHIPE